MNTTTKRIEYLDLARGFGMLAVIWGHIYASGIVTTLIYAFHMPLFFFLSGMMYRQDKNTSFNQLSKRLWKKLILPYFIFSIITWLMWLILAIYVDIKNSQFNISRYVYPLMQTFLAQGSGGYLIHNVPLWFIPSICVMNVLYFYSSKYKNVINIFICVILALVGTLMIKNPESVFRKLPWCIDSAFTAMPFFAIGNLLAKEKGLNCFKKFMNSKKFILAIFILVGLIIFVIGSIWNGHVSIGSNCLGKSPLLFYAMGFLGLIIVITLCALWENMFNNKFLGIIKWIGNNSFYFMVLHMPINMYVSTFASKFLGILIGNEFTETILFGIINFFITFVVSSTAVIFINIFKNKFNLKII